MNACQYVAIVIGRVISESEVSPVILRHELLIGWARINSDSAVAVMILVKMRPTNASSLPRLVGVEPDPLKFSDACHTLQSEGSRLRHEITIIRTSNRY